MGNTERLILILHLNLFSQTYEKATPQKPGTARLPDGTHDRHGLPPAGLFHDGGLGGKESATDRA